METWPRPIPVSERLPEPGEDVLTYGQLLPDESNREPGDFETIGLWNIQGYRLCTYDQHGNFVSQDDRFYNSPLYDGDFTVTHWLPMPPKPE